jgi:predicted N-acetyltransferase YhbS
MTVRHGDRGSVVRPATTSDIQDMSGVLERAGLSSHRPEILEFSLASSGTQMFVGCRDGRVVGVAGCVSFGRTGWLGNVGVDDDARGQGLGRAISQTAVDCLRRAGVETVLLTATDLGRPVYERLGFTDEGVSYGIWERAQPLAAGYDDAPAVQHGHIDEVIRQDAEATGEERHSYLASFGDQARATSGRHRDGFWVSLPWGGGPIIAANGAAARPLVVEMIRTSPGARLAFPELNEDGTALAVSLGFRLARRVRRMRLGPPVAGYRPEMIYNVFSLATG